MLHPVLYARHRPEQTTLYRLVQQRAQTFFAQTEEATGASLAQFTNDEFDAFLECGILAPGFLRLRCADCGHDTLFAFNCKRRGFCPSCGARHRLHSFGDRTERCPQPPATPAHGGPAGNPIMSNAVPFLIVDDRPGNLMVVRSILEPDQYALVMVQSAQDALLALLHTDFAAALLDVKMPEMDGYELAGLIRERKRNRHLPIIFVSAHLTDPADARRGYAAGAVDYLCKPVDARALRAKVAVFAELYRERKELVEQVAGLRQALRTVLPPGDGPATPRH